MRYSANGIGNNAKLMVLLEVLVQMEDEVRDVVLEETSVHGERKIVQATDVMVQTRSSISVTDKNYAPAKIQQLRPPRPFRLHVLQQVLRTTYFCRKRE